MRITIFRFALVTLFSLAAFSLLLPLLPVLVPVDPLLTIVFLIKNKVAHPRVWDAWAEEGSRAFDGVNPVNFVIHPSPAAWKLNVLAALPAYMRSISSVVDSATCRWGHTTPCMHAALVGALKANKGSQFFAFASEGAVPLKRIDQIHASLFENPRSRFFISNINMVRTPKHHQWIVLTRKHAQMLADNPMLWTEEKTCRMTTHRFKTGKRGGADDELCPLRALSILTKNSTAKAEDYSQENDVLFGYEHVSELWKEINFGHIPPLAEDAPFTNWNMSQMSTFVCWHNCDKYGMCDSSHRPCRYASVKSETFQDLISDDSHWFARSFLSNCTIQDRMSDNFDEWLIDALSLNRM